MVLSSDATLEQDKVFIPVLLTVGASDLDQTTQHPRNLKPLGWLGKMDNMYCCQMSL